MPEVQIEGRYLLVGYPGLPAKAWARVLYYQHADLVYRPAESIDAVLPEVRAVGALLVFDPLTGQRWQILAPQRRP